MLLLGLLVAAGAVVLIARGGAGRRPGPAASVPIHIATWAYDDGCSGGASAAASLVRRWVSYAESSCGPDARKALSDCHAGARRYCTAVQYLDASKLYRSGSVPVAVDARESWWVHVRGRDDAAHRAFVPAYGGGFQLDQSNPAVVAWFQRYVRARLDRFDALMMDDMAAGLKAQFGVAVQELPSDAALRAAHARLSGALRHVDGKPFVQIDNGVRANPYLASGTLLLGQPASVRGVIDEGEPIVNGQMPNPVWGYPTLLDEMAYVDGTTDGFDVLLSYDPSGSLRARRVQVATVLLGYAPGHTVSWSDLEQRSRDLAVWPEEGIVPTRPVQSMTRPAGAGCLAGGGRVCSVGGHNDIVVAPGVYRREFGACYDQRIAFGRCAVIVNSTGAPVVVRRAWLTGSFRHVIGMVGGDVQSGGRIDLDGVRFVGGSTVVGAHDALLVAA